MRKILEKYCKTTQVSRKVEKTDFLNVFVRSLFFFEKSLGLEFKNGPTTNAVDIQLTFVGGFCYVVSGKCLNLNRKKHKILNIFFFDNFSDGL